MSNVADHPCSLSCQGHQFCQPPSDSTLHLSLEALYVLRRVVAPLEPGREERRAECTRYGLIGPPCRCQEWMKAHQLGPPLHFDLPVTHIYSFVRETVA
jgi:hypothetical protein